MILYVQVMVSIICASYLKFLIYYWILAYFDLPTWNVDEQFFNTILGW
jgi:hypothetical protein